MDSFTTLTLACSLKDVPWAAAVYYAREGFDLIFFSSRESRHSSILGKNPKAAGAIHGDYTGWKEIKGLQMEGVVKAIRGPVESVRAIRTYVKRYPFAEQFLSAPEGLSHGLVTKMTKVALYVFRPSSILYLDNEMGFGTRWKLDIKDGRAVGEPVLA
jgi:uncharacterized protein YhbP (UPF0306 family)